MATNDVNLQIINSMTQEQMQSLKDSSGKIPSLANQLIMTDEEDMNLSYIRTEVIYDVSNSNKRVLNGTTYASGIVTGTTVNGLDFSKYDKLFWVSCSSDALGRYQVSNVLDKSISTSDGYWSSATLYSESPIRMGIQVSNTSIYAFGTSNTRLIYLAGILKTPAMIYTGAELHEGDGIKIENGVISTTALDLPSNTYETLSASENKSYTAPANGWYCATGASTVTSHAHISLANSNGMATRSHINGASDAGLRCYLPAKKGDVVTLTYNSARVKIDSVRFYYAEGVI